MNSEIKFRVWDRVRNCWINEGKTILSSGNIFRLDLPSKEYFIMLSSGLRDINGIEIFDGDIVKEVGDNSLNPLQMYTVTFNSPSFRLTPLWGNYTGNILHKNVEVVDCLFK